MLERLGDSEGFAWLLLDVLTIHGWTIVQRPALRYGLLVIATHPGLGEVTVEASNVNGAAPKLFERCALAAQTLGARATVPPNERNA